LQVTACTPDIMRIRMAPDKTAIDTDSATERLGALRE